MYGFQSLGDDELKEFDDTLDEEEEEAEEGKESLIRI
jgi:hypothetical protein